MIRSEEKGWLPGRGHGPAQRATGLVAAKFSSSYAGCVRKEIVRVQGLVAAEVVGVTMKLGGTRLGLYDDVGAAASPILSIVERILNLELLNGLRCGNHQRTA